MSLFCLSCQNARFILSRATCNPATTDHLLCHAGTKRFLSTFSRHFLPSSPMSKTGPCHSKMISLSQFTESSIFGNKTTGVFSAEFCTNSVNPEVSKQAVVVTPDKTGAYEGNEEQLPGTMMTSEQKKALTSEELQVLREIEEEERVLLEKLGKEELQLLQELEEEENWIKERQAKTVSTDEDVYLWDGTFDNLDKSKLTGSVSEGYVPFKNQQRVIQDVIEEMWNPLPPQYHEEETQYFPRGKTGIFDLGELVDLLREEHGEEVVAISLPKEMDWADYMVIVTVLSNKHLQALAQFVRKRCKQKDLKDTDELPHLEKFVKPMNWVALDLGNIILHIFCQETRDYYDLEMLWTVGPVFDDLTNSPDTEIVQLLNTIQ